MALTVKSCSDIFLSLGSVKANLPFSVAVPLATESDPHPYARLLSYSVKRQSPMSRAGEMGLSTYLHTGPSCFTPPGFQRGLRAKNGEDIILKCAKKVKEFK